MAHPGSANTTMKKFLENNLRLPPYQRDFAWKQSNMIQLWDDLRTHVIATTQTKGDDSSRYYLGSIVIDSHSSVDHLVDGQQRFTTLSLIACAIRDALITSGFTEEAYDIHHGLIRNMEDGIDDRNRY